MCKEGGKGKSRGEHNREVNMSEFKEARSRAAIFLPNAVTTASMLFGFYSIQQSIAGNFVHATWALLISAVLDSLDGRIARLVKGTSEFGEEYDSLADLVSFGLAPAILSIKWGMAHHFGEYAWAAGFIYLAGTAIRLARFNVLIGDEMSKKFFKGMPSPCAAGIPVTPVMVYTKYVNNGVLENRGLALAYLVFVVLGGVLMISPIRFRTFKDVQFTKYGMVLPLFGFAIILCLLYIWPQATLFGALWAYLGWAFLEELFILRPMEKEERIKRKELRKKRREGRRKRLLEGEEKKAEVRLIEGVKKEE